jgi:hypothetical protein
VLSFDFKELKNYIGPFGIIGLKIFMSCSNIQNLHEPTTFTTIRRHHHQLYSPLWASTSRRIFFHDSLSLATVHQFLTFSFLRSSSTPSFHRSLGRPTLLRPSNLHSIILLGISLSLILSRCPAHRSLVILITLVILVVLLTLSLVIYLGYFPLQVATTRHESF